MRVLVLAVLSLCVVLPALAADKKPARPCALKNKELCGKWVEFTLSGDRILWDSWSKWDKQYGDVAYCDVLDERRQPDRVFSILRCIEHHHADTPNCKEEVASRFNDEKPQRCIDPANGKGQSYTIEQPTFWLFMARKVQKQERHPRGIEYTYVTDKHINCLFLPISNVNDAHEIHELIKFQKDNQCHSFRQYLEEIKSTILPVFGE